MGSFAVLGNVPVVTLTLVLSLACTVYAYGTMTRWQPHVSSTQAGLIYATEPVFASAWALFLPGWYSALAGIHYPNEVLTWQLFAGGGLMRDMGQSWSDPSGGGPFGWLSVASSYRKLPTYLEGEPSRDWGALYVVDPYNAGALPAEAATRVRSETRWGTWDAGPLYDADPLPGPPVSSRGRTDLQPVVPANPGADT